MKRKNQHKATFKKKHILVVGILLTGICLLGITVHRWRHAAVEPQTLSELLDLPEDKLARVDIARMNLLCATGLPNSENIRLNDHLQTLDRWAEVAKKAEEKYLPTYYQNPAKFENSLSKFKAITLALTIQEDLKCKYNIELVRSGVMQDMRRTKFFSDSRDLFVHGLIERRTGTCSSLPVLIIILGRRCGYPLYLVTSKGHLFCRWQDSHETFNIEAASRGVNIFPDSHYRTFPYPFTNREMNNEKYLKTLTSFEELGVFMNTRGLCLQEHNLFRQAVEAYGVSLRGFSNSELTRTYIDNAKRRF
ncbi:MAG: transglutaminase-like domain-containing protein [Bacteroidales bacterium]|jgi:hypothetical protein|nr:transglutaminase-like domain-containing protein [Bacteroidales bacterium]